MQDYLDSFLDPFPAESEPHAPFPAACAIASYLKASSLDRSKFFDFLFYYSNYNTLPDEFIFYENGFSKRNYYAFLKEFCDINSKPKHSFAAMDSDEKMLYIFKYYWHYGGDWSSISRAITGNPYFIKNSVMETYRFPKAKIERRCMFERFERIASEPYLSREQSFMKCYTKEEWIHCIFQLVLTYPQDMFLIASYFSILVQLYGDVIRHFWRLYKLYTNESLSLFLKIL